MPSTASFTKAHILSIFLLLLPNPWTSLTTTWCPLGSSLVRAVEVVVTKEWQQLGENDTIPAGMHVRMDMTTGEKWVKLPDETDDDSHMLAAVVQEDGSVRPIETDKIPSGSSENHNGAGSNGESTDEGSYDYEMMHRTLANLPVEEQERMGGIPELPPVTTTARTKITSKERQEAEAKLAAIWKRRQEELKDVQELLMDVPEVLKERMQGIRRYLKDPEEELQEMDDDMGEEEGMATNIVSILADLEFQLTDVDNARDFHTMGGWSLLVSLLADQSHISPNSTATTISQLPQDIQSRIYVVQTHAAWTIGTAVKNTGEFFPFAVEAVPILDSKGSVDSVTTAIDLAVLLFVQDYPKAHHQWEVRNLLAKSIYAIGALLRGNRLAQAHLVQSGEGVESLAAKLRSLATTSVTTNAATAKLLQRLLSLASDIVTDVELHGEPNTKATNAAILQAFSSPEWCDATSLVLLKSSSLSDRVYETVLETLTSLAPYCSASWKDSRTELLAAVDRIQTSWRSRQDDLDAEHLEQLLEQATKTSEVLARL